MQLPWSVIFRSWTTQHDLVGRKTILVPNMKPSFDHRLSAPWKLSHSLDLHTHTTVSLSCTNIRDVPGPAPLSAHIVDTFSDPPQETLQPTGCSSSPRWLQLKLNKSRLRSQSGVDQSAVISHWSAVSHSPGSEFSVWKEKSDERKQRGSSSISPSWGCVKEVHSQWH